MVFRPDHPATRKPFYIAQHRLVMEEALGRFLLADENVHHVNGDRQDNRLANLELWSKSQPCGQRVEDKAGWAVQILRQYRPELLAENFWARAAL